MEGLTKRPGEGKGAQKFKFLTTPMSFQSLGYLFPSRYLATLTKLRQRQWQQNITVKRMTAIR